MNGLLIHLVDFGGKDSSIDVNLSKVWGTEWSESGEVLDCFQGRTVDHLIGVFHQLLLVLYGDLLSSCHAVPTQGDGMVGAGGILNLIANSMAGERLSSITPQSPPFLPAVISSLGLLTSAVNSAMGLSSFEG